MPTTHKNYNIQSQGAVPGHGYPVGDLAQLAHASRIVQLGRDLVAAWNGQSEYNDLVRERDGSKDPTEWTLTYILGMVSEMDEVLRELHWKKNRARSGKVIESNLARELADLTKFVLSLWQQWGFTPEDMLGYVLEKNEVLSFQWQQDQDLTIPYHRVILFDMDGTVADYRTGLVSYLRSKEGAEDNRQEHYEMDLATGLDYEVYHRHKNTFEENGGYKDLPSYVDATNALRLIGQNVGLCAVTARPKYLSRSWIDSYTWLKHHIRQPDQLWLMGGERLALAKRLREKGHDVVCWEDAPMEALRYAEHGFQVWMRNQPYNLDSPDHPNIYRVDTFSMDVAEYFGGESND